MKTVYLNFPKQFIQHIGNQKEVKFSGETIKDLLVELDKQYGGDISDRIIDNDSLREYLQMFHNQINITKLNGLETSISSNDTLTLLLSRAGG